MKKILGIDFGEKRIGIAISDETGSIARAYGMLFEKSAKEIIKSLVSICQKEKIGEIVVGLPLNLKGEEGVQAEKTKRFVDELKKEIKLPIILEDERLSTKEADRILRERGVKGRKEKIDTLSAVLILQQYLERK